MEQQQLDPLINAAVLAGDDVVHQMRMQQQQQQPPSINGAGQLHQQPEAVAPLPPLQHHHQVVPQAAAPATAPPLLHNVVHTTMYPPAALGGGGGGGGSGGQPLQSHPTLPQLPQQQQQQQQQVAVAVAQPRNRADHTNYNSSTSNSNTLTLNHPQNESYKLKTNQYLLETSSRLDDAVSELNHYSSLLSQNTNQQQQSSSSSKSSKSSSSAAAVASSTNTIECITNIEQSIIPLLKLCSTAMKDAGKYFAPFSGTTNIHNRNDAERKRKLVLEEEERVQREYEQQRSSSGSSAGSGGKKKKKRKRGKKKRPALLMINDFVERNKFTDTRNFDLDDDYATNTMATTAAAAAGVGGTESSEQQEVDDVLPSPQFPPTTSSTTRKRKSLSTSNKKSTTKNKPSTKASTTTTDSIIILRPQNGTTYTKSEAIAICKKYRKNSRERGLAIRAMIHRKYVLASRKTLYRLLQQDEEGKVLYESGWLGCGRPLKVDLTSGSGSGGVNKGLLLVNDKLTFEDLDKGEENRILVRVNGKDDGDVEEEDGGENNEADDNNEEKEEGEGLSESNDDDDNNNNYKQSSKKKRKKGKTVSIPPPPAKQKSCSAPGCANQVARRGLCVKHGMEHVDSKVRKFKLPLPRDGGTVYKKSECIEIAKQYKKGTSERRLALEAMIYRGYAKNSLKSLYRLLLNDEKGIPIVDDDWRGLGCPSVLSATEIDEVVERIKREDIRLSSDEDVRQLVVDALRDKGVTDESKLKFSATTVKNYGAIFKSKLSTVYWKNTGVDEFQQQQQQGFV